MSIRLIPCKLLWVIVYSEEVLVEERDFPYIYLQISLGKVHFKRVCHFFSLKLTVMQNKLSKFGGQSWMDIFGCVYKSRTK